ncbi:GNAT family N-acetyltransferase [Massilia horti]|uniref:N-acetyltransferase n=1 Tax=Massilia horti TaxID=2562153 RepID=A0A4Y9T1X1_9BURK|nr:GNAT family N-acetyltransferase [Massilia horti]TFW32987.1 N-acetyltransferase [Massilia horti]
MAVLETPRLRLEPMAEAHLEGLHAMNSDPAVMRYITGRAESLGETRAMIERVQGRWRTIGYSWWSLFERATGELIGAAGVQHLGQDPANPLELGWRLRRDKWGQGFASEVAQRMAEYAFGTLQGELVCAICRPDNRASAHVMEKLGMRYKGQETWHGHDSSVYQITRSEWNARRAA